MIKWLKNLFEKYWEYEYESRIVWVEGHGYMQPIYIAPAYPVSAEICKDCKVDCRACAYYHGEV